MPTRARTNVAVAVLAATLLLGVSCQPSEDGPAPDDEPVEEPVEEADGPDAEPEPSPADPYRDLRLAAQHVGPDGSGRTLAVGVAAGADLDGDIASLAARTWAQLSTLLAEHVYLTGLVADATYATPGSGGSELAQATLDENAQALADVIADVSERADRDAFLELWRDHTAALVGYVVATGEADGDARERAADDLDDHGARIAAFLEDLTDGELSAETVRSALTEHGGAVTTAVDALADGDPDAVDLLREAASQVSTDGTALVLAQGLAVAMGTESDLDDPAVDVHVELSTLLAEHVYLTGLALQVGYAEGLGSGPFGAAVATLDANSVALADLLGSITGAADRDAFLDLWREHVEFLVDHARGAAEGDERLMEAALADLEGFRERTAAFLEEVTGGELTADVVSEALRGHIETLTRAVGSLTEGADATATGR